MHTSLQCIAEGTAWHYVLQASVLYDKWYIWLWQTLVILNINSFQQSHVPVATNMIVEKLFVWHK